MTKITLWLMLSSVLAAKRRDTIERAFFEILVEFEGYEVGKCEYAISCETEDINDVWKRLKEAVGDSKQVALFRYIDGGGISGHPVSHGRRINSSIKKPVANPIRAIRAFLGLAK